jgi:peptidyl-dipeptidase Dcp
MGRRLLATVAVAAIAIGGVTMAGVVEAKAPAAKSAGIPQASGPFAHESTLPFHAPDFSRIKDSDFKPAFEQGMAIQTAEVAAIADNPAKPTFANTIVALEKSGRMLGRVQMAFSALTSADTNDALDKIDAEESPKLAAHFDAINLNPKLFARVKALYDSRATLGLDAEDTALLEKTYKDMVHAGALLTPAQKEQVKAINTELSSLTTKFSQTLTQATKDAALVIDDKAKLAGLSDDEIAAAAKAAADRGLPGKYVLALQNTTQQPQLASLTDRDTRKALYEAGWNRATHGGDDDTRATIARIAELRAQKAALFGDPDYATWAMYDRMAKDPKTALDFMRRMVPAIAASQRRDAAALDAEIKADGKDFTVQPWDWTFYSERLRKKRFDIDEDTVKPYFELRHVLEDGVFYAANRLYGVTFKRRTDLPVWNPDMWVYTVYDKDGSELGLYYFDPFQRDNKQGGAWMDNLVQQSNLFGDKPVVYNVLNIPKAPAGQPQLISFDWAETMFHEFGHALHGLFGSGKYASMSGANTARDFVEYPSQANEMWATYPEVLAHYAKHYQTGAPIPHALIDKLDAASKFNQGYDFGEVVEAALLDMQWHALSPDRAKGLDADAFETNALAESGLETGLVPPRYRSSYFRHIWANGYAAGYYSYLWTEMLAKDTRQWFLDHGGLTPENGARFRAMVLSKGQTEDYAAMYKAFTGHNPSVQPLLAAHGLTGGDETGPGAGS